MRSISDHALFPWAGAKYLLAPKLLDLFPPHRIYVSVFGGSGSEISRKPRSQVEVYNDLNELIVTVFRLLRNDEQRQALIRRLTFTLCSRQDFREALKLLHSRSGSEIDRAWAFLLVTFASHRQVDPMLLKPHCFAARRRNLLSNSRWLHMGEHIVQVARRFRRVIIENLSWEKVLEKYDGEDTFFYCDPPYVPSQRVGRQYEHEMSDAAHSDFAQAIRKSDGKVMVSGYRNAIYEELLADWNTVDFKTRCFSSTAEKKPKRTETVWMNYEPS